MLLELLVMVDPANLPLRERFPLPVRLAGFDVWDVREAWEGNGKNARAPATSRIAASSIIMMLSKVGLRLAVLACSLNTEPFASLPLVAGPARCLGPLSSSLSSSFSLSTTKIQ